MNATALPHSPEVQRTLLIRALLCLAIAVSLLFLNLSVWRFSIGNLSQETVQFYWQQHQRLFSGLECWAFWLSPAAIVIAAWISLRQLRLWWLGIPITVASLVFLACGFVHYFAFFVSTFIDHVGSVRLGNHIYHLARVVQYDNSTTYHLGICDASGYWCRFHKIYEVDLFRVNSPAFYVDAAQRLVVKINENVIYSYDGLQEQCINGFDGRCIVSPD